jgi:CysZ protein
MWAIGASTLPVLLLAPLQDPISEATEALCGGFEPKPFRLAELVRQTVDAVAHTLLRIFWLLLGHAALLALTFVPGVGQLAWTVSAPLWTMGWLAAEYLDGPMTRHGHAFSTVRRVVWGRLGLCLGFGAAVYLILWVPVLNFFFIPLAIVGGTLLYRGLRACGSIPPPPLAGSSKTPSGLAAG